MVEYLKRKIFNNFNKTLIQISMFFVIFSLLFLSNGINSVNNEISDYLFKQLGIKIVLYGDINDINGISNNIDEFNAVKNELNDIRLYLNNNNISCNYEEYLKTIDIYTAENIYDSENYRFAMLNDGPEVSDPLPSVSRDIEHNGQYRTIMEDMHIEESLNEVESNQWNFLDIVPTLIGVNDSKFSELNLKYFGIGKGRKFTQDELDNGDKVAIVNQSLYIVDRDEIRNVEIGDYIPITIRKNGEFITYEFEVVGITNSLLQYGGISVQGTYDYEYYGMFAEYPTQFKRLIYIPEKTLTEVKDVYLNNNNPSKDSNGFYGDEVIYYSQHGGIRPIVISIETLKDFNFVTDYLKIETMKLNEMSNRVIDYTYYSNLDRFIPVIGTISNSNKIFAVLSVGSIVLALFIMITYITNDLESSKKELAICISLGKNRFEMVIFKFVEYVIVGIIPLIMATILAVITTNKYVGYLNSNLIDVFANQEVINNYVNQINASLPISSITVLACLCLLIIFISCLFGYIKIKRISIKEALLEGEIS